MLPTIRRATRDDLPELVRLLLQDAARRCALDPAFWILADDARGRIEKAVGAGLENANPAIPELWHVAQLDVRIVGVTHAIVVPVPPIYDIPGPPGLLLDDCCTTPDAPAGTAEALLLATEAALRHTGASGLIASCPAAGAWRTLYTQHNYEPVTLYMAKHEICADAAESSVRLGTSDDIPGIVALSADHRRTLSRLNPRFWPTHPDADSRFEGWMRYSLMLNDRDMLVAGADTVRGYVIAQPVSSLLAPAAHDLGRLGLIDDFYTDEFAAVSAIADDDAMTASLLRAAEGALARRGFAAALAVCPVAWTSKVSLLERNGYRPAKLWLLKG